MHPIFKKWRPFLVPVTIQDEFDVKGKKQVEPFAWKGGLALNKNSVALLTGNKSVNVVDVDTKDFTKLVEPFKSWCDDRLLFEDTLIVETLNGYHFYFYSDSPIKTTTDVSPFVDIRGQGGVIFVHSTSKCASYTVICDLEPTKEVSEIYESLDKAVNRDGMPHGYESLEDLEIAVHFDERPSQKELEEWLSKISADTNYQTWSDVLRALNSWDLDGELGAELAVKWSRTSKSHNLSDSEIIEKYHQNIADVPKFYAKIIGLANKQDVNFFEKALLDADSEFDFEELSDEISESTINNEKREELAEKIALREVELGLSKRKRAVHWKKALTKKSEKKARAGELGFPDVQQTQNGIKIRVTSANLLYFIENHSELDLKYDVILKRPIINNKYSADDVGINTIGRSLLFDELTRLDINAEAMLRQHFDSCLFKKKENGLLSYIDSLPKWDGETDYIAMVADTLHTNIATRDYKYEVMKSFVIQAIAAWDNKARTPIKLSKVELVMVFVGTQGGGKTTWANRLMPKFMSNYFKDGLELNPSDKDSYIEATQAGLVELGELDATTKKADISSLKSFLSKSVDEYRAPYGRSAEKYPRQTVFFGTVNNPDFLKDPTGSRRFLTLDVKTLALPDEDIVLKMWAQALALYLDGNDWRLSKDWDGVREKINSRFTDVGSIGDAVERLVECIELAKEPRVRMSVTKLIRAIGEGKINSRERSDFISMLDVRGIARDSQGRYYLPADLVHIYNHAEDLIVDEFEDLKNL